MTYLALARKWRPRTFEDVVGQPHIVRALTNALTSGRVHHAFLFAGTRGVGKTTVARILARCLNCEQGVSASPCGECSACKAIEEGRFVDLLEVDAASRTGIDDMRDLLDNVQYTPSAGRYKVYLIDEVHMLSKQAFNALLKTLEEPPPHVKFLFATTDPQKLPVTVLSRCLQFNLKRLPGALIIGRMEAICKAEGVAAEHGALARLARAAAGSMRDALSLLDQALAFGNESLRESDVAEMLGSLDRARVLGLLEPLAAGDPAELMARIRQIDELVPDYASLLDDMATALQKTALLQIAGADGLDDEDDLPALRALAAMLDPETTQLYYQIAVLGRRDLAYAPDPRVGFEMALLRMVAFSPAQGDGDVPAVKPLASPAAPGKLRPGVAPPTATAVSRPAGNSQGKLEGPGDWAGFLLGLGLDGAARQLAMHTECKHVSRQAIDLSVTRENAHLATEQLCKRLATAVQARLGADVQVRINVCDGQAGDTLATRQEHEQNAAMQHARQAIETDQNVRDMESLFRAEVVVESIKPAAPARSRKA